MSQVNSKHPLKTNDRCPGTAGGDQRRRRGGVIRLLALAAACALPAIATAEKSDRNKPVNVEADKLTIDDNKKESVFEGNVTVRVITDRNRVGIGRGFVTGGGDALRPFTGQIAFAQPNGGDGWVLFQEESAANGDVVLTTAVPVTFAGTAEPSATVQS